MKRKVTKEEKRVQVHGLVQGLIVAVLAAGMYFFGSGIVERQAEKFLTEIGGVREKVGVVRVELRKNREELRATRAELGRVYRFLRKQQIDLPVSIGQGGGSRGGLGGDSGGGTGPSPKPVPKPGPNPGPPPDSEPPPTEDPGPIPAPVCDLSPVLCGR